MCSFSILPWMGIWRGPLHWSEVAALRIRPRKKIVKRRPVTAAFSCIFAKREYLVKTRRSLWSVYRACHYMGRKRRTYKILRLELAYTSHFQVLLKPDISRSFYKLFFGWCFYSSANLKWRFFQPSPSPYSRKLFYLTRAIGCLPYFLTG